MAGKLWPFLCAALLGVLGYIKFFERTSAQPPEPRRFPGLENSASAELPGRLRQEQQQPVRQVSANYPPEEGPKNPPPPLDSNPPGAIPAPIPMKDLDLVPPPLELVPALGEKSSQEQKSETAPPASIPDLKTPLNNESNPPADPLEEPKKPLSPHPPGPLSTDPGIDPGKQPSLPTPAPVDPPFSFPPPASPKSPEKTKEISTSPTSAFPVPNPPVPPPVPEVKAEIPAPRVPATPPVPAPEVSDRGQGLKDFSPTPANIPQPVPTVQSGNPTSSAIAVDRISSLPLEAWMGMKRLVETYQCSSSDTGFESVSRAIFGNERYAKALANFNHDYPPALQERRGRPIQFTRGTTIFFPPKVVLEKLYPETLGGLVEAPRIASSSVNQDLAPATWKERGEVKAPGVPAPRPAFSPWTFHLEIIDGRNVMIARLNKVTQFKVDCDKIDMQAPQGGVQASGSVRITANGIECTGDRLTIQFHEEAVLLEGKAFLRSQRDGQEMELRSDRFTLKLTDTHAEPTAASNTHRPPSVRYYRVVND